MSILLSGLQRSGLGPLGCSTHKILMRQDLRDQTKFFSSFRQVFPLLQENALILLQRWVLSKAFHIPLVSILLRMIANNLMKLNIVLASKWEDVIVRRAENGPVFPYGLDILEPFLAIPILIILTLLSFFWALVVIWARTFYALVIGIALIVPVNFLCRFTLALTGNYFFYGYLRNNGYISGNSFISKAYITGNSFLSKAIEGFLYPSDT